MEQNAVLAASARLANRFITAIFALTMAGAVPALGGDRALLEVIGYSSDGRYFAFEQYGVQDGSGFPYSDVFVLDLPADKWLYGSPFHAQASDDAPDRPLAKVRAEARMKAQGKLNETAIVVPAVPLALIGDGIGGDGKMLAFSNPACCGSGQVGDQHATLTLTTFPIKVTEDYCADMNPVGYALRFEADGTATEPHRDGAILPASRRCTLDYRIYGVFAPLDGGPRVAIIASYPFGFEGPDRRFLAAPLDN